MLKFIQEIKEKVVKEEELKARKEHESVLARLQANYQEIEKKSADKLLEIQKKDDELSKRREKVREEEAAIDNLVLSNESRRKDLNRIKEEWTRAEDELIRRNNELKSKQADVEDMLKRVETKKLELEKANNDLREQVKLIEAKASPDSVWIQAFSLGFSKAWDVMMPIQAKGIHLAENTIKTKTTDDVLNRIEPMISSRLEAAGMAVLKPANQLISKKLEFEGKLRNARNDLETQKYKQYLEVIGWVLNGNDVQKK